MMRDFTGFSFDNIHSSRLGIIRVSEGDGYDDTLLPDFEDATSDIKGINEQYYFGSQYKAKHIKLSIAYDHMTEIQFRQFRKWLSTKTPCPLIFDEEPYKLYMAKIENSPELSYICFDEPKRYEGSERDGVRVVNRNYVLNARIYSIIGDLTIELNSEIFIAQVENKGIYTFHYIDEQNGWYYNNEPIDLENYGIECTGTPIVGNQIIIEVDLTVDSIVRERVTPWEYEYDDMGALVKERIYKGTGSIEFVCYYPLARAQFKILDLYGDFKVKKNFIPLPGESQYYTNNPRPIKTAANEWDWSQMDSSINYIDYGNPYTIYENVSEWAESSGIMPYSVFLENNIDTVQSTNRTGYTYAIPVYNPGDVDAPFNLFIPYYATSDEDYGTITPANNATEIIIDTDTYNELLILKPITAKKQFKYENGIMINTRNHLIEGVNYNREEGKWETTGELYNEYIARGDFGKILCNKVFYPFDFLTQTIYTNLSTNNSQMQIHYNYLYY